MNGMMTPAQDLEFRDGAIITNYNRLQQLSDSEESNVEAGIGNHSSNVNYNIGWYAVA